MVPGRPGWSVGKTDSETRMHASHIQNVPCKFSLRAVAVLAALMSLTACATAEPTLAKTATTTTLIVATAQAPELSTFTKLVQQAGLSAALEAAGPVTVFAPTDEAFKAVPAATLDKLSKDPVLLKSVLTYHMIPGGLKAADLGTNTGLTTLNGAKLAVSKAGDFVTVDDGLVTKADINATNGVIHEIDRLLMPAVNK